MATMTQGPSGNKGLLQSQIDWMAQNAPEMLTKVTTQPAGTTLQTGDEARLSFQNNYLLGGSQQARDRVASGQQPAPAPYAVGSDGKVVGWTQQGGSVTYDTPPAGFVADPALTPDWTRAPLDIPQVTWTPPPAAGGGGGTVPGGIGGGTTPGTTPGGGTAPGGIGGGTTPVALPTQLQTANTNTAYVTTIQPSALERPSARTAQAGKVGSTNTWNGQGYNAANAGAASAGKAATTGTTTVQGLLGQIMAQDNPLMQQARTQSQQQMASRGLLNSSMAIGAGQSALYNVAMPIAQQDAQAYNQTGQFNASAQNQMAQYNAGNQQQTNLANQTAQNQANQFGADARNQAASSNAAAANNMAQYNASNQQQTNLANAQAQNQMAQYNATNQFNTLQANMQAQNQGAQFNTQQQNAQSQFNASQSNDVLKTQMEHQNRTELANIEASYKTLMQANQSAGELYQQTIKNITDLASNKDMDPATKTTMINNQIQYMKAGMGMFEVMNGLDGLTEILNFEVDYPTASYPEQQEAAPSPAPAAPAPSAPAPVYQEPFRDAQ